MLKIENFALCFEHERFMLINELHIGSGTKVNIFGDNKTGKSLLLKSIHGDFTKFEGNILIKEKPPTFYKKRKNTILIENVPHLLLNESIWKNIVLPLSKISSHQKQKIMDLCMDADLNDKIGERVKNLSFSSQKFVELIRAVIQLPYLILIDDIDNFFDEKSLLKALNICDFALNSGATLIATSKYKLAHFELVYKVQDKRVVKL
ncbi:MAG: ATP-binding cassette domain-containing protein [Candidatus Cloacimonetes bacterium]|nr:ATP-binding cassette domain-containing protein [Candidatus Cloacimonadota bacterium]